MIIKNRPHDHLVIQECFLPQGELPPGYFNADGKTAAVNSGWRVGGGGMNGNNWMRVIERYELLELVPEHQSIRATVACGGCGSHHVSLDNSGLIESCEDCGFERA